MDSCTDIILASSFYASNEFAMSRAVNGEGLAWVGNNELVVDEKSGPVLLHHFGCDSREVDIVKGLE